MKVPGVIKEFSKYDILCKFSFVICTACIFCGNTWLFDHVSNLAALQVAILFLIVFAKGIPKKAFFNFSKFWMFVHLLLFDLVLLYQYLTIAFVKGIVFTYFKYYLIFPFIILFIFKSEFFFTELKILRVYAWIAGLSSILMTALNGTKSGGLLGNYQAVGMMMSISCMIFSIFYFSDYDEKRKKIDLFGIILSLICILISGKRTFALITLCMIFFAFFLSSEKHKRAKAVKLIVIVGGAVAFTYTFFEPVRELFYRTAELMEANDEYVFTSGRSEMWEVAMEIFNENKVLGIGFGTFPAYTARYYPSKAWAGMFLTHNIYYGLLSETGLAGTILLCSFLIFSLLSTAHVIIKYKKYLNKSQNIIIRFSLMMQIWFMLYGFTGNGIYDSNELFLYLFSVAMMISVDRDLKKIKKRKCDTNEC